MAQYDDKDEDQTPEAADAAMKAAGQEDDDNADLSELSKQDVADVAPQTPDVKSYIAQKYGLGSTAGAYNQMAADSKKSLDDVSQKAQNGDTIADYGQSLATIFKGRGPLDASLYNNLRKQDSDMVGQAAAQRQDQLKNYLTANQLGRQDVQDQMAREKFGWDRDNAAFAKSEHDRQLAQQQNEDKKDSVESQFAQRIAKTLDPKGNYDGLSATQIKAQLPMVKDIYDQTMKQQDMQLRWAQLRDNQQWQRDFKNSQLNGGFVNKFNKDENTYQTAAGKIDETMNMVDQATNKGGVTSKLVPLEVARQIAGRLNPQEIAAAGGDPSIAGQLQRMVSTADEGKMDGLDADQFRALLQAQKDNLTKVRQKQRDQNINSWAQATHQDPEVVRTMALGQGNGPSKPAAARAVSASDLKDYATKHNMSPDDAAKWLKSQHYDVEGY